MTQLTDVPVVRCAVIGDSEAGTAAMLRKFGEMNGVMYIQEAGELVTAFKGQKCEFYDLNNLSSVENQSFGDIHVFLLCVSVASKATADETVEMIMRNVIERICGVPFVLVGTDIDLRTAILHGSVIGQNNNDSVTPMALSQAEKCAKRIGAIKYMECSATTGEGLDEVFEDAFAIGRQFAVEQKRVIARKMSAMLESNSRKQSCITQ